MAEGAVVVMSWLHTVSTEDTPVWMAYFDGQPRAVLVSWANYVTFDASKFLTFRTFSTCREAEDWIDEFWDAFWVVAGSK